MTSTQPGSGYEPDSENGIDGIDYPVNCDECGRGFLTQQAHNAHQRVHADEDEDLIVAPDGGEVVDDESSSSRGETFRTTIDTLADANDAFKRMSKLLDVFRREDEPVTLEIGIEEVDRDA